MKLTNNELVGAHGALGQIFETPVPVDLAIHLADLIRQTEIMIQPLSLVQDKLKKEGKDHHSPEWAKLMMTEIDLDIQPLTMDEIRQIGPVSGQTIYLLGPITQRGD